MMWPLRILTALMALYFLYAVAVQYNDPDPVQWMAIYGAAALACGLALVRRLWRWFPVGVALVAAVWAATLAPGVIGHVAPRDLFFAKAGMLTPRVEEAREMLGLTIVVVWMSLLAWAVPSGPPKPPLRSAAPIDLHGGLEGPPNPRRSEAPRQSRGTPRQPMNVERSAPSKSRRERRLG